MWLRLAKEELSDEPGQQGLGCWTVLSLKTSPSAPGVVPGSDPKKF